VDFLRVDIADLNGSADIQARHIRRLEGALRVLINEMTFVPAAAVEKARAVLLRQIQG
jgi:hypothetical protein